MAQKADFKTVETDLDELEEKIRKHRRKIAKRIIIVVAVVVAVFLIGWLWMALRTYKSFDVRNTVEQSDKSAVSFVDFCGAVVEYSNDGILYTDSDGNRIWNQAFEMSTPQVAICDTYMVVYDRGGTDMFVMDKNGVKKEIETSLPIIKACIAKQGTVAVLVSEDSNYYVKLYDVNAKELASGEFFGEQKNIPVDIALSYDAKKLAVDMIDISGGKTDTVISFYNFGSVGQNEIDNNVGTYTYEGVLIPEISYVSENKMVAIGDDRIMVFEGSQKPSLKQTIELDKEVDSVFYNERYIGIAYGNNDEKVTSHIKVYDYSGKMLMENDTGITYSHIEFDSNNEVCVTNDVACEIYTIHGVKKFSYTFDKKLYEVMYKSGLNNYIFIYEGSMDEVRLK